MERDHGPSAEGAASFHTTRWTIVMRAAQSQAQGGQSALAELCRLYWYLLYIFARRRGHSPDDAKDLTQGFFLHVVERRALTGVDRLKGRFRSFLLASFQNHLSDAADHARRLKRGGDKEFVYLDAGEAEERYRLEPVEFLTPEKIFDARWAMTVLGEALKQLRQEYADAGKTSTFEVLKVFLDPNNNIAPPSYEEVASRLQVTTGAVKTLKDLPNSSRHPGVTPGPAKRSAGAPRPVPAICPGISSKGLVDLYQCVIADPTNSGVRFHRLRKRCTALLGEEVGRTVSDSAEIDEEIQALCDTLVGSEGRLGP